MEIKKSMKNIKAYGSYKKEGINEGIWDALFGKPTTKDAAETHFKAHGWSHTGREDDENYVMFNGQKFLPHQIQYDDVYSTKPLPRVEDGVLIIANPAWRL